MLCCALSKISLFTFLESGRKGAGLGRKASVAALSAIQESSDGDGEVTVEVSEAAGLEQDLGMDCILKARNGEREVGKDQNDPQVILPFLPLSCHFPLIYHHRKNEKEPVRQLLCSVKARS